MLEKTDNFTIEGSGEGFQARHYAGLHQAHKATVQDTRR